jgi:hypothetical protein
VDLVRKIGSKANFGAAVFPSPESAGDPLSCVPGHEVFATQPGDTPGTTNCAGDGMVTLGFAGATSLPSGVSPSGGTPTAATLHGLVPTLAALPGRTALVLATDGGPNCNENATCDMAHCIPNIEQDPYCNPAINCCGGDAGYTSAKCLDAEPTKNAVLELKSAGIATYVIGIPGSAPYRDLLDELAAAGGTARSGEPAYYDVEGLDELDTVLSAIGSKVLLSCHLTLSSRPPDLTDVRVFLDQMRLTYGSPDGWSFGGELDGGADREEAGVAPEAGTEGGDPIDGGAASPIAIDLQGRACTDLMSGRVRAVQVVSGCPPDIPR